MAMEYASENHPTFDAEEKTEGNRDFDQYWRATETNIAAYDPLRKNNTLRSPWILRKLVIIVPQDKTTIDNN